MVARKNQKMEIKWRKKIVLCYFQLIYILLTTHTQYDNLFRSIQLDRAKMYQTPINLYCVCINLHQLDFSSLNMLKYYSSSTLKHIEVFFVWSSCQSSPTSTQRGKSKIWVKNPLRFFSYVQNTEAVTIKNSKTSRFSSEIHKKKRSKQNQ